MTNLEIHKLLEELAPYVSFLKESMALRDWSFDLDYDPLTDDAYAQIECVKGRKRGIIAICPSFFRDSEDGRRHTLVHELVHCHLRSIQIACETIEEQLSSSTYEQFSKCVDDAVENATDGVADGWAKMLPTFPKWKKLGSPNAV